MVNKAKVLVVDDEIDIREIVGTLVTTFGFEALAENGEHALEIAKSANIDLVISDLMMPQLSGVMLLDEMRKFGLLILVFF